MKERGRKREKERGREGAKKEKGREGAKKEKKGRERRKRRKGGGIEGGRMEDEL